MRASSVALAIIDVLEQNHKHLSAQEVYEQIRERLPAVNPSTVYRALERLVHQGQISVSDLGTGQALYEAVNGAYHHHLVCEQCGTVLTVTHDEVNSFFHQIEEKNAFKIHTNHLVLFGICAYCQTHPVEKKG